MEITRVAGIATYWAEGGAELTAALIFRVGRADEPPTRAGLTHLVEHLALHSFGGAERHFNGMVDATTTTFVKSGTPEEVARFLTGVCDALNDLPLDRMDAEKQILRTEEAGRGGALGELLLWRYGPQGPGLLGYDEIGLPEISRDDVREWARTRFTRGNAVLVFAGGPPPEGLNLTLPDGPLHPVPPAETVLPWLPATMPFSGQGVGLLADCPRTWPAVVYRAALGLRLHRVLRQDKALSYAPAVDFQRYDGRTGHLLAHADCLEENRAALVEAFLDVLEELAAVPLTGEELAHAVEGDLANFARPEAAGAFAHAAARNALFDVPAETFAEARAALEAVTADDVLRVARTVRDSALVA
ncbi:M16 family metallopeptidase, partial [Actinocorallia lasiicapitis]